MAIPFPLQEALRDSITSGTFVDTKFWVFSKRGSKPERIGEPKPLFVNGHVTKRVPRLASLLDKRGVKENLRARFSTDRNPYTSHYDYENDSDLEGDYDDEGDPDDEPASVPQVAIEKPRDDDVVVVEKSDANSDDFSDILSISDLDSLFSESSGTGDETGTASSAHVGKVVVIEDVAFVTFRALLRYLYTDEIKFAPWGSTERRKARTLEMISKSYGIPKPSPKSVYRLADKYEIPELKELALRQIQQDLSECNIIEEVFSRYTSWYPELRELELKQLARVLLSSDPDPTLELLKTKIKSYVHGELPHAEYILPALYEFMESDEFVKTPLPAGAPPNQQATGGCRKSLKRALTNSLTSGTFLDSQFYAVESRSSTSLPTIRPIYFCSTVDGSFASKLVAYSSELGAQGAPPLQYADGYDSDIDDENPDPEGAVECYPCSKFIRENHTAANLPMEPALLLKSGAAKTWSALFLYVYTSQITFVALGSRDVTPSGKEAQGGCSRGERKSAQDSEGLGTPLPGAVVVEPCSPRSTYCLADKVGLTGLCDVALKDIRSKLDENNIVQELFSPFAANYERIREMEHKLLRSELKLSVDSALVSDIIRSSSSGLNSHRTAVIELILERSIQERRKRMLTKGKNSLRPDSTSRPEASQNSSGLSKPTKKVKVVKRGGPPAGAKMNPSQSEEIQVVELVCRGCRVKRLRRDLMFGVYCKSCPLGSLTMECVGCGTARIVNLVACPRCHWRFK